MMGHGVPIILSWAANFSRPSWLLPEPHVEQISRRFSPHTSQSIPQAPVGIDDPYHVPLLGLLHEFGQDDRASFQGS